MDSERQLRAGLISALEAVTPPAPWLASTVRESLRMNPRRGGKRTRGASFTTRGLSAAVAVALVLLLGATAAGIFTFRSLVNPSSAHPGQGDVAQYAALLTSDRQALNEAYGGELVVGDWMTSACGSLTDMECPAFLSRVEGSWQRMLYDLDRTPPPTQFRAEHARLQADLRAFITALRLGVAAFNAGDGSTVDRLFNYGIWLQDDMILIEAYVIYESGSGRPARDAATTAYLAAIGRDYDSLRLQALFSSLFSCTLADAVACAASVATTRTEVQAFLADLLATTPPDRFAFTPDLIASGLNAELQSLDRVDAAIKSGDESELDAARNLALSTQPRITDYSEAILYIRSLR